MAKKVRVSRHRHGIFYNLFLGWWLWPFEWIYDHILARHDRNW